MSEEEKSPPDDQRAEVRFPMVPPSPEVPDAPRLAKIGPPESPEVPEAPRLARVAPPVQVSARSNAPQPGEYRNQALAYSAVSQFVTPIIVIGMLGWWLQNKFHFAPWGVLVGFTLGFVVGVVSLMNVMKRMSDGSPK